MWKEWGVMGFNVAAAGGRDEVRHIRLSPALPCGIGQCGRPTTWALVEDDLARPALWTLLPICEECAQSLAIQRGEPRAAH